MDKSLVLCVQARNHLQTMKAGDKAFFYHSNCKQPGIAGIVEVSCVFLTLKPRINPMNIEPLKMRKTLKLKK